MSPVKSFLFLKKIWRDKLLSYCGLIVSPNSDLVDLLQSVMDKPLTSRKSDREHSWKLEIIILNICSEEN